MTTKADFTEQEWDTIAEGPTGAGLMVSTAQRGGTFREAMSMGKAYAEARGEHGDSELLDELVNSKPDMDRTRHGSVEELQAATLQRLRDAVALLEQKATPEELEQYRGFVLALSERVAKAKDEGDSDEEGESEAERTAIAAISDALGSEAQPGGSDPQ
jgi:hypothetical protein